MASSRILSLRLLKRPVSARIPRISSSSTSFAHSRYVHASAAQYAKKKKQKGAVEDDLFDESDDEGDLFGSSSSSSKPSAKPTTPLNASTSSSLLKGGQKGANAKEVKLSKEQVRAQEEERKKALAVEAQRLEEERRKDQERLEKFAATVAWIKNATGEAGKESNRRPRQDDLVKLIQVTKSQEEWQSLIGVLRQWRIYPGGSLKETVEHAVFERAIETHQALLLIPILEHHPVYGLSLPTPSKARALLKAIVSPAGTYPPSYSNTISANQPTPEELKERLNHALRLAQLFSSTSLQAPIHYSSSELSNSATDGKHYSRSTSSGLVSLSPSKDLISGPILLSALLRVASTSTEAEQYLTAARELASSLVQATESGSGTSSGVKQELNWALAALNECQQAVDSGVEIEGLKTDLEKLRKNVEKERRERREMNLKRVGMSLGGKRVTSDEKGEVIADTLGALNELKA